MITWFAGLGIVAKLVLASTVATAAVVGAGAAGVLPDSAQDSFDSVVAVGTTGDEDELPTGEPTDEPTAEPTDEPAGEPTGDPEGESEEKAHPDNFGGMVSDLAHDKTGSGNEFGKFVSNAARNKDKSDETTDPSTDDDTDSSEESGEHTNNKPGGKPEGTPGGGNSDHSKKP